MDDSETGRPADASLAALRAELASIRDLLVERDAQLAEQDKRLAEQAALIRDLRDEIRRLKKLPRRPLPHLHRREVKVGLDDVPAGAVHKGYQDHTVCDIVFHAEEVTCRREVWQFPDGSRHVAPLPFGVATGREQYGPGVKALVIMLYHQCQSTIGRIASMLNAVGLDISARQVGRFLNEATGDIVAEQQEVLKAGMETAVWINVDDTGARHKAENGYCTAIGNDFFAHFRSTGSKSRLDFLAHLCAGEEAWTINDAALEYMRKRKLSGKAIASGTSVTAMNGGPIWRHWALPG